MVSNSSNTAPMEALISSSSWTIGLKYASAQGFDEHSIMRESGDFRIFSEKYDQSVHDDHVMTMFRTILSEYEM